MFPQKRRIKKEQIKKILKKGKIFNSRAILLKTLPIPGQLSAFSIIISSKIAKKATQRNQLKRRARAIIFKIFPILQEGFLTLVFLKKEILGMKFSALKEEMEKLFFKAGIINKII